MLRAVTLVDDRPDDLGDHVTGLAEHHGVADQHALAGDLARVVQGGEGDRGPGDAYRLDLGVGGDPAGAPDVDPDVDEPGVDLLGRVLVGDRPTRRPAGRAEPALDRHVVHLHHD